MTNKNLILTRKTGDRVIVHQNGRKLCTITITNISTAQCKLGFEADKSVRIDREEVYLDKEI
jgi:carbon storage regulator CsrA